MDLRAKIWGRQNGKNAKREEALTIWQDWQAGNTVFRIPLSHNPHPEYPVCPVCFCRYKVDYAVAKQLSSADRHNQHDAVRMDWQQVTARYLVHSWMLRLTAPPIDTESPLQPEGPSQADGCRCRLGYTPRQPQQKEGNT